VFPEGGKSPLRGGRVKLRWRMHCVIKGLGTTPRGEENGGSLSNIGVTYEGRRKAAREGHVSMGMMWKLLGSGGQWGARTKQMMGLRVLAQG